MLRNTCKVRVHYGLIADEEVQTVDATEDKTAKEVEAPEELVEEVTLDLEDSIEIEE